MADPRVIGIDVGFDRAQLEGLGRAAREKIRAAAAHGLSVAADVVVGELRRQSGFNPAAPLHRRTGTLARSWAHGQADPSAEEQQIEITARAKDAPQGSGLTVGSPVPYARIQEEGGTVRAKAGGKLTIPIGDNLTGQNKDVRYRSVQALRDALGAKNVFYLKRAGKAPVVMAREGKDLKAYFVLKDEVELPARKYISIAIFDSAEAAQQKGQKAVADALGR